MSLDCIKKLNDLLKTEAAEKAPEAAEKAPEAAEKAPEAAEKAPEAAEKAPEAAEKAPEAAEKAPEAAEKTPKVTEKVTREDNPALGERQVVAEKRTKTIFSQLLRALKNEQSALIRAEIYGKFFKFQQKNSNLTSLLDHELRTDLNIIYGEYRTRIKPNKPEIMGLFESAIRELTLLIKENNAFNHPINLVDQQRYKKRP